MPFLCIDSGKSFTFTYSWISGSAVAHTALRNEANRAQIFCKIKVYAKIHYANKPSTELFQPQITCVLVLYINELFLETKLCFQFGWGMGTEIQAK